MKPRAIDPIMTILAIIAAAATVIIILETIHALFK